MWCQIREIKGRIIAFIMNVGLILQYIYLQIYITKKCFSSIVVYLSLAGEKSEREVGSNLQLLTSSYWSVQGVALKQKVYKNEFMIKF